MAKERGSQEKGQARIQELTEMFPELPRVQVVTALHRVVGLRHTAVLDEIGRWSTPDAHDHYEYDYDEHNQEDLVGGVSRTPKMVYFANGINWYLLLDSRSPHEVRYEGGGRYWLYRDGEPIEEVYFAPCPQWFWKTTSSGKPMNQMVDTSFERRFFMYVNDYCVYFKDGAQCLFCNLNPTGNHFAQLGRQREPVKREQDVYETYMAWAPEVGGVDGINDGLILKGGSFYDRSKEADLCLRNIAVLQRAIRDSGCGVRSIKVSSQALEEEDQRRLKEAGVTEVQYSLEVWGPKLFEIICPGKAKYVGRERWIESLLSGVEIFGWGNVTSIFVLGLEMLPPFGFKSEEEAAQSVLEGMHFMASHGVVVETIPFQPRSGAVLAQASRPRIEHILRLEIERDRLHKEYNLPAIVR